MPARPGRGRGTTCIQVACLGRNSSSQAAIFLADSLVEDGSDWSNQDMNRHSGTSCRRLGCQANVLCYNAYSVPNLVFLISIIQYVLRTLNYCISGSLLCRHIVLKGKDSYPKHTEGFIIVFTRLWNIAK